MSHLPTFQYTNEMVNLIAEISEAVGKASVSQTHFLNPHMYRAKQIQTVRSSLRIEGNSLSINKVTDVIDGKRVVAPQREILEVKNAFAAYQALDRMEPSKEENLLEAHRLMMAGLSDDAGSYRTMRVGVYSGPFLIHAGIEPNEVPAAMRELFNWLVASNDHPLIQAAFFHCAFECIHPFSDGNGRMGRLWHSLIARQWNDVFTWLPVETMVDAHRADYYQVLGYSDTGDATLFIEFLLEMTRDALADVGEMDTNVGENVGVTTAEHIVALLKTDPTSSAAKMADQLGMSKRQIERVLAELKRTGRIKREGSARGGRWVVVQ